MTIVETELKETELKPGDTFTRDGNSVTVHFIHEGEVYYNKYRAEESGHPLWSGLGGWGRVGLAEFGQQVAGATRTEGAA